MTYVVDQYLVHHVRSIGKKMRAVPRRQIGLCEEFQGRAVRKLGWCQHVARSITGQESTCESSHFLIYRGNQLAPRVRVAAYCSLQQFRDGRGRPY